jgi:hypothetical protein
MQCRTITSRAPPATSPLFPGKQPAFPQFNQQGRQRVVTAEKPLGLAPCVLPFRNERIWITIISDASTQQEDGQTYRESLRLIN